MLLYPWIMVLLALQVRVEASKLTAYWISQQGSRDMTNDGRKVDLPLGPGSSALLSCTGTVLAHVHPLLFEKCRMEGTCLLQDGRLMNLGERNDCFMELDRQKFPFGTGSRSNPLEPFISVASNAVPQHTLVYLKQLDGLRVPVFDKQAKSTGLMRTHNGCVRVDDVSWSFGTNDQYDLFVVTFSAYEQIGLPDVVEAEVKECQLLSYVQETAAPPLAYTRDVKGTKGSAVNRLSKQSTPIAKQEEGQDTEEEVEEEVTPQPIKENGLELNEPLAVETMLSKLIDWVWNLLKAL